MTTVAEEPLKTILCQHNNALTECQNCQMLAFLCVNNCSTELPYMVEDASRLIFKQLQGLYKEDALQKLLFEQWERLFKTPMKEIGCNDRIFARMLTITKKRYAGLPNHNPAFRRLTVD